MTQNKKENCDHEQLESFGCGCGPGCPGYTKCKDCDEPILTGYPDEMKWYMEDHPNYKPNL